MQFCIDIAGRAGHGVDHSERISVPKAGRSITFSQGAERSVRYLLEVCGDKPIDAYSRTEVNAARDFPVERGLSQGKRHEPCLDRSAGRIDPPKDSDGRIGP